MKMTKEKMLAEIAEYELHLATLSEIFQMAAHFLMDDWSKKYTVKEVTEKYNEIFGNNTKDLH